MKIDFTGELRNWRDEPIMYNDEPATLATACLEALLADRDGERASGQEKAQRYALAMRIVGATEPVAVTAEEIALIKERVAMAYGTYVTGLIWAILENDTE